MTKHKKKAFSLVELMVTITILAILWTIWVSINSGYRDKTANTKVSVDLSTIENSFRRYNQEIWTFPSPSGNLKYFTSEWNYAHDENEAYWVHWYLTENTIPKRFINVMPIDPKTWNYYAYGKVFRWWTFEVAWVLSKNWTHETILKWNFSSEWWLYNIIREYNWPWFVYDKSKTRFPYNPDEFIMTAKISSFTWSVIINDSISNSEEILNKQLVSWDNIKLTVWSTASLYFSDWSVWELWGPSSATDITLSNMTYKKENNLFTKVSLALNFWSILVKASKMSEDSEFNVYTSDTEASVRWTIFRVSKMTWETKSTVSVTKWFVAINKVMINDYQTLTNKLKKWDDIEATPIFDLPAEIVEIKTLESWVQESILKEWNTVEVIKNAANVSQNLEIVNPRDVENECSPEQHMESGECKANISTCEEWNGSGTKSWTNWSWGDCVIERCSSWFTLSNWTCIEDKCKWNIPANAISNATSQDWTILWVYNNTSWVCTFKCKTNYNWNWSSCNPATKTSACTSIDTNTSIYNTVDKITQTWNWNTWIPSNITTYSATESTSECRFKCKSGYQYSTWTKKCEESTKNITCLNITNWIFYNGSTNYTFTVPISSNISNIPTFNSNPTQKTCQYKCKNWYTWNWTLCEEMRADTPPPDQHTSPPQEPQPQNWWFVNWQNYTWCDACPEWFFSKDTSNYCWYLWAFWFNWKITAQYCNNVFHKWASVICRIETSDWFDCTWEMDKTWHWTYTPTK